MAHCPPPQGSSNGKVTQETLYYAFPDPDGSEVTITVTHWEIMGMWRKFCSDNRMEQKSSLKVHLYQKDAEQ